MKVREVTHMYAEFGGVSEEIHGVIASNFLCYQCLFGGGDSQLRKTQSFYDI